MRGCKLVEERDDGKSGRAYSTPSVNLEGNFWLTAAALQKLYILDIPKDDIMNIKKIIILGTLLK